MTTLLLTGGAGYIGSHLAVSALESGYSVVIYENFSNSEEAIIENIQHITGKKPIVIVGDVLDNTLLANALRDYGVTDVIHLAGLKSVEESIAEPARYHRVNVEGTESLLQAMDETGVKNLIFSSSATVYGEPEYLPLDENHRRIAVNPYAQSKLDVEILLEKYCSKNPGFGAICLRYFNPVGSHDSGLLGDKPKALRANLMPMIGRVVTGERSHLDIYGDDYDTGDGTCIRDYIHILDLVEGHLAALVLFETSPGFETINLGTGQGISVLELINAFKQITGEQIPVSIAPRRAGDVPACYADCSKAKRFLHWQARRDIYAMCESTWKWCQQLAGQK
jgi:UDP-glucose 4-epimerase